MPAGTVVSSGSLVSPGGQQGPSGPGGPSVVSADAGNWAILGSDSKIYVPSTIRTKGVNGLAPGYGQRMQIHDDCSYPITQTGTAGLQTVAPIPWYFSTNGGVINQNTNGLDQFNKCYGIFGLGANAGSLYAVLTPPTPTLVAGLGALDLYFRVAFTALPSAANQCAYNFGISDGVATANNSISANLVWSGSAAAWLGRCISGGTATNIAFATSPTPLVFSATALTFFTLRVSINAAWNSVTIYVNGIAIGTITTGIFSIPRLVYFWMYTASSTGGGSTVLIDDVVVDYQYVLP